MLIKVVKHDEILGDLTGHVNVETFSQLVKVDRKTSGLDAFAYAKTLGVTRQTINLIESGRAKMGKMKMAGFAALRGYDVNDVLKAFCKEES